MEGSKKRLHARPTNAEVKRYRGWLVGRAVTLALVGKAIPMLKKREQHALDGCAGFITVHPSSLLRAPDGRARREGFRAFVGALKAAKKLATTHRKAA